MQKRKCTREPSSVGVVRPASVTIDSRKVLSELEREVDEVSEQLNADLILKGRDKTHELSMNTCNGLEEAAALRQENK